MKANGINCRLPLFINFIKISAIATKVIWHSRMQLIRSVLDRYDHERGNSLPSKKLSFMDFWAIGLFTQDGAFCSQYQNDRRNSCGCKWVFFLPQTCLFIKNGRISDLDEFCQASLIDA